MATITGMTAAAMEAIQNATVVSGSIGSDGHLTLEQFDGTIIDAGYFPAATTGVPGFVELATTGETDAITDPTIAVTPAGLANLYGRVSTLETNPVKIVSGIAESASYTSYPAGVSLMILTTGSSWSLANGLGAVVTTLPGSLRAEQTFYSSAGGTQSPQVWVRTFHTTNGGGGWTAWSAVTTTASLTAASFSQSTLFTSYPQGDSRLYYTSGTSTSWDFAGLAGEVHTYTNGTDFAKQTFTEHVGGASGVTALWIRTANSTSGWSPWEKAVMTDANHPLPTRMLGGTTSVTTVANTPTLVHVAFPAGVFTTAPIMTVTAFTTVPGTVVTGVSANNVTTTGVDIYITRTTAAATSVFWTATQF